MATMLQAKRRRARQTVLEGGGAEINDFGPSGGGGAENGSGLGGGRRL